MSATLYLQCLDHDPPLVNDSESGKRLSDLDQIRSDYKRRDVLLSMKRAFDEEVLYRQFSLGHPCRDNTLRFFEQHPHCKINVRDEYGHAHSLDKLRPLDFKSYSPRHKRQREPMPWGAG